MGKKQESVGNQEGIRCRNVTRGSCALVMARLVRDHHEAVSGLKHGLVTSKTASRL